MARNSIRRSRLIVRCWPFLGVCILAAPARANGDEIVGARNGKVYHTQPDCPALKRIVPENRVIFATIAEAEAESRHLCRMCQSRAAKLKEPPAKPAHNEAKPPMDKTRKPDPPTSRPVRSDAPTPPGQWVRIKNVLPGGSLQTDGGETITLLGVGCPQTRQEQSDQVVAFIQERLHSSRKVLFAPVETDGIVTRDRFGRMIGYVQPQEDKPDLGTELVAAGLGWVDRDARFDRSESYVQRETEAWQKGRGIWQRLDGATGRREVLVGRYARQYHAPGCPHATHLMEASIITLNEAKARRMTPCEMYGVASADSPTEGASSVNRPTTPNDAKDKKD